MQTKGIDIYRQFIGEQLSRFNRSRGITRAELHRRSNISQRAIIDIEEGNTSYTIDTFIKYIIASELYIFFGTKDKGEMIFDPEDLIRSMTENDPKT